MRIWKRHRAWLALPIQRPSLLAPSIVYAGLLHMVGTQVGLLDIQNPYWVLGVGGLLLLSPVYHALLLPGIASTFGGEIVDWRTAVRSLHIPFARLFVGEIVVAAAVIAGGFLLLIPGIYIGMRLIYYKQAIVFGEHSVAGAFRESFRRTTDVRSTLGLFGVLAVLYGCAIGLDTLLVAFAPNLILHVGGILGTALLLTWMNVAVTAAYSKPVDGP